MLAELVNYAEWLKRDFPELFEGGLTEGLHISIEINENDNFKYESRVYRKNDPVDSFLAELRKREIISNALGNNKGIIDKVIFSNNPYAIFFKLYFSKSEYKEKLFNKEEWENFKNEYNDKNFDEIKEALFERFINEKLENLFRKEQENRENKNIIDYYNKIEKNFLYGASDVEKNLFSDIKNYVENNLKNEILNDQNFVSMFIKKGNSKIIFEKKFFDKEIRVNFLVDFRLLEKASNRYFANKIFVKSDFNVSFNKKTFGLPSFFNKAAEEKKLYNFHRTALFNVNKLVETNWAYILNELINIKNNLPNPLPIFIDKDELNAKVITIFKADEKKGYKEIISELVQHYKDDLGNYYLLNFTSKNIYDLDFVASFNFYLDKGYSTKSLLDLFKLKYETKLENIFDIEEVLDKYFLFKLNRKTKTQSGILKSNYFTDKIDPMKGNKIPDFVLNNLYKYRKTIYDAIFKSRLYLITPEIIKHICLPVIYYEIFHDETNEKGFSKNENRIKEKLLIYFLLNEIFDKKKKNTGGIDMASKLPEYFKNLKDLLDKKFDLKNPKEITFKSDEDFAFSLGQLIRYLLELSESGNKNHSMFNPFLQKLNNYELFMNHLKRTFETYSHKIKMHYKIFDRVMSNITSYELENKNKKLKDLELIIISGYFADSVIGKKIEKFLNDKKKDDNKDNNENKEVLND